MNIRTAVPMDKAQFAAWAERQERRYELVDGRVVMLPNVSRNHGLICTNVVVALSHRLNRSRYGVTQGDFAVETGDRSIRYADIMVELSGGDGSARSTTEALLLVEVLSPSTMHVDFGEKLEEYKALQRLGTYMICAQHEARVWIWSRGQDGWPDDPTILEGSDAAATIPILEIALPLSDIYLNVSIR